MKRLFLFILLIPLMAFILPPDAGKIRYEQLVPIQVTRLSSTGVSSVKLVVTDGLGGVKLITNAYSRDSTLIFTRLNRHVVNDLDTVKTNELITDFRVENDTAKITEAGVVWKAKVTTTNPYIADSALLKQHVRTDLDTDPTNELQDTTSIPGLLKFVTDHTATIKGDTGVAGADGKSAYQVAVANGFIGTEAEWLASLVGAKGDKGDAGAAGADGNDGTNGLDGKSAYQIAVENGFVGTEPQWLASLECNTGTISIDSVISGTDIKYGDLYNYYTAISNKKIAAPGWHVPSIAEVDSLAVYLGGPDSSPGINDTAGGYLKQSGTNQWDAPNTGATNSSGFNGVGSGIRAYSIEYGYFQELKKSMGFWTTSIGVQSNNWGVMRVLHYNDAKFSRMYSHFTNGHAIRLIKDDTTYVDKYVGNDLKVYKTVKIGKQIWLSQNLAETRFRDGSLIPTGNNGVIYTNSQWTYLTTPGRCSYNNDATISGGAVNLSVALNDLKAKSSSLTDSLFLYVKRIELADSLANYVNRKELSDSLANYICPQINYNNTAINITGTQTKTFTVTQANGNSVSGTFTIDAGNPIDYSISSVQITGTQTKTFTVTQANGNTKSVTFSDLSGTFDPKNTKTAYVDVLGNNTTGIVGDISHPYLTIDGALDALGSTGGIVQIGIGEFTAPTSTKIYSNTWFKGSGKPMPDWTITTSGTDIVNISQPNKLVGGTIIHGSWLFIPSSILKGNIKITDLGIDVGNYWCTNSNGGVAVDGLLFAQKFNISGGQSANDGIHTLQSDSPPLYGVVVNNVISLCKSNSTGIHCNLFENVINPTVDDVIGVGGSFGIVIKSIGGNFRNLQSFGSSNTGLYIKSDDYANCKDAIINGFYFRNLTGITTTFGILLETFEYSVNSINISNFAINGVTYGIYMNQSASFPNNTISNCRIYNGFITGIQNGAYLTAINASGNVFNGINIKSATGDAVYSRTLATDNNTFSNIVISGSGGDGFDVSATTNLFLNDCTVSSSSGYDYNFSSNIIGTNLQGTTFNGTLKNSGAKNSPLLFGTLIGGSGVTDVLNLQGTSSNGTATSPAVKINVGNNGGTNAVTVLNNGMTGFGTISPGEPVSIVDNSSSGGRILSSMLSPNQPTGSIGLGNAFILGKAKSTNDVATWLFDYAGVGSTGNSQAFGFWGSAAFFRLYASNKAIFNGGSIIPSAFLNVYGTTEQFRMGYDASNYNAFTVASNGALTITANGTNPNITLTPGGTGSLLFSSDAKINTVGKGLYVKEGTNATMGTATLVAGTATVATTKVTSSSRIYITVQSLGTVTRPVAVGVTGRVAGTSFTITSNDATDTSVVSWVIIEPS